VVDFGSRFFHNLLGIKMERFDMRVHIIHCEDGDCPVLALLRELFGGFIPFLARSCSSMDIFFLLLVVTTTSLL
jgi:hypothetical protein